MKRFRQMVKHIAMHDHLPDYRVTFDEGTDQATFYNRGRAMYTARKTVDIDLAMYDDLVGDFSGRKLPDPDILMRSYVALPLAEISPDQIHPETGEPLQAIAGRLRNGAIHRREEIHLLLAQSAGRPAKR